MLKYIYVFLGSVSLGFGILGFITPGLPVTPLILLTGFFYAKGSPRLHKRLEDHKITGKYLKRMNGGFSPKAKLFSILFMWCMISFTVFVVFANNPKMQYVMLSLGVIGTISQILFLKKKKLNSEARMDKENQEERE